jgi:hypothetical protein
MSKHSLLYIPVNAPWVDTGLEQTSSLVNERFDNAKSLASEAWSKILDYVDDIKKVNNNFEFDWEKIAIDYEVDEFTTAVKGQRPDPLRINDLEIRSRLDSIVNPVLGYTQSNFTVSHGSGPDDLKVNLFAKLITKLAVEGTGLGADVEAAIWARMRSRQETQNTNQYYEAENYFASRGFTLPPGALSGKLNEISIELERNNTYLNNDITIEQAKLAQTNTHFLLSESWKAIVGTIESEVNAIVAMNKSIYDKYLAELEANKIRITKEVSVIENIAKGLSVLVQLYGHDVQLGGVDIEAKYKYNELRMKESIAEAEIALKKADFAIEETRMVFASQNSSLDNASRLLAQVCASALSSVNASASMGFSASANSSASGSVSSSYQDSDSYSESKSQTEEI